MRTLEALTAFVGVLLTEEPGYRYVSETRTRSLLLWVRLYQIHGHGRDQYEETYSGRRWRRDPSMYGHKA